MTTPRIQPTGSAVLPPGVLPTPVGFLIPRTVHLADQVLPAFPVFTTQPPFAIPAGTKKIAMYIVYTRANDEAGSFPVFRAVWGNGVEVSNQVVIDASGFTPDDPTTAFAQYPIFMEQIKGPTPADNTVISYKMTFCCDAGETLLALFASERGAPGNPGTMRITLTGST